jgi:hypothetical protein
MRFPDRSGPGICLSWFAVPQRGRHRLLANRFPGGSPDMSLTYGLLLILSGLALMGFGLLLFYAWLPLLYGFLGLDLGLALGSWLTGSTGVAAVVLATICALAFALMAFFLEPLRRILLGLSAGALLGVAIGDMLGLSKLIGGAHTPIIAFIGALIGGLLVPMLFRQFVVLASAFSGATLVVNGAAFILPGSQIFDYASGRFLPTMLVTLLGLIGMAWQIRNIETWAHLTPGLGKSAEPSSL